MPGRGQGAGGLPSLFDSGGPLSFAPGGALSGLGSTALKWAVPGVGPVLGLLSAAGLKIPLLDSLFESLLGGMLKTAHPDLPEGMEFTEGIRYTTEDGPYLDGDIIISSAENFPVARWSYSRQKVQPLGGLTREGYCLFVNQKGATHSMAGQDVGNYDGEDADALNAQAATWAVRAAEFGIPGGAPSLAQKAPLIVAALLAARWFLK